MPTTTPNFDFELPGCEVEDDFTASLGDPNEGMLSAALNMLLQAHVPSCHVKRRGGCQSTAQ